MASGADGVIHLSRAGRPTFVDGAARTILAAGDGLAYSRNAFVTCTAAETRRLQQMIRDAVATVRDPEGGQGGQMLVTRPSGLRPYVLRVAPVAQAEHPAGAKSVACIIYLHDPAAVPLPSKASLCTLYELTEREADLALALVQSATLVHAASNAGMALNTARNHLQSIFRKSGASNQAEAVQLFSRLF